MNFREKYFKWLRGNTEIKYKDILFCLGISLICVLFFCHRDLLITAERSVGYIQSWNILDNVTHFYSNSLKNLGDLGANYLPTTFIIFAIWNIPLKILNLTPHYLRDWGIPFTLWNKILPVMVFILCGYLIYKICLEEFDFSENKSKLAMFLFVSSPISFFSQFIFCQYDIFTIFFMLLGIYFYYKKNHSRKDSLYFLLSFGIAFTFKYFVILIFFILIFLREKKIVKIIEATVIVAFPAAIEVLFYYVFDKESFVNQVFNFGVLNFATQGNSGSSDAIASRINLLYLFFFIILAFAYLKKTKSVEENISYFLFLSCGVCAILFSLMSWNPQWLLFGVPFWTLTLCINKNYKALLFLDCVFIYAFYAFVTKVFDNNVDQTLLQYGVLKNILRYKVSLPVERAMQRFFILDTKTLLTIIVCILIFYFLCSYYKFNISDFKNELRDVKIYVYIRYLYATMLFLIPAILCAVELYNQPEKLWASYATHYNKYVDTVDIADEDILQEICIPRTKLGSVQIETNTPYQLKDDAWMKICILNEKKEQVAECKKYSNEINKNGYTNFYFNNLKLSKNKSYYVKVMADSSDEIVVKTTKYEKGYVYNSTTSVKGMHDDEKLTYGNKLLKDKALNMIIYSK